ncbi:DUF4430 domain-containing protein [Paenibacillus hamazuiensis]|uniref:DUF4430 domain-containing protein n=1 Tax=Paenibacillus hamazuiensis TaxID=2936508 RepID=UPI00200DB7A1|nr:DUF4430 domain-containing protein [Paenibacillus hamazuiensis]
MNKLFLSAVAIMILAAGCGTQAAQEQGKPQTAAQAEAGGGAGGTAPGASSPGVAAAAPGGEPPAAAPAGSAGQAPAGAPAASASAAVPAGSGAAAPPASASPGTAAPPPASASAGAAAPPSPAAADPAAPAASASALAGAADQTPAAASPAPAADAAPSGQAQAAPAASETAELHISITGDKERGVILKETSVPFKDGMTVLDVLKQVTKDNKIQMEYTGKGAFAYVQGIDNLYEFDGGPKSGWIYKVNGRALGEGAGSYKLKSGDKIEWLYTLDLGADVGAKMK